MDGRKDRMTDRWTDRRTGRRIDRRTDRRKDRRTDRWAYGQTDCIGIYVLSKKKIVRVFLVHLIGRHLCV